MITALDGTLRHSTMTEDTCWYDFSSDDLINLLRNIFDKAFNTSDVSLLSLKRENNLSNDSTWESFIAAFKDSLRIVFWGMGHLHGKNLTAPKVYSDFVDST